MASLELKDPNLFREACYINGKWVGADSNQTIDVTNPATGDVLGTVPKMGADETRAAIEAANEAYPAWRAKTAKERASILRRWFDLMMENQEDLARMMTAEQGKPLKESMGEIVYAASFIEWFAEEGKRIYGDTIPQHAPGKRIVVTKEPIGVCAAITPWNFPAAMITRKCGPALAAGCTMVVKPATATPYSALALAELAERAGVPAGVFSVVTGSSGAIGGEMTSNPIVRKLTFTGSTEIGKLLMEQCAGTVKKTSMELGGNAPFIVFNDADLDEAVEGAMASKFRNTGQTCVCANRILVQAGIHDAFVDALQAKVNQLKVGAGTDSGTTIGPLIHEGACDKVESLVNEAIKAGAARHSGCERKGNFITPGILTGVEPGMRVAREEIFGPVAPVISFETEADAIALANDTRAGLAAYVFTENTGRIFRVSEALEYGIVGVNEGIISNEMAPFGGMKESGNGREGSKYGLDDYLEIKYVCLGGL